MSGVLETGVAAARIDALPAARIEAGEALLARDGTRIARLAAGIAERRRPTELT